MTEERLREIIREEIAAAEKATTVAVIKSLGDRFKEDRIARGDYPNVFDVQQGL